MSRLAVGRNYGGAIFELAWREDEAETYGEWLRELATLYTEEPSFRAYMDTPRIPLRDKKEGLRKALGAELPELLMRFLMVVLERRRQGALPAIADAYERLLNDRLGRRTAHITLPFEPDEALRNDIVAAIEQEIKREVIPRFETDPSILGGLIVRVRDHRMDGSLRRQLEQLKWRLTDARRVSS